MNKFDRAHLERIDANRETLEWVSSKRVKPATKTQEDLDMERRVEAQQQDLEERRARDARALRPTWQKQNDAVMKNMRTYRREFDL